MTDTTALKAGDRCTVKRHEHYGSVARIMAVAEGYAMLRYPKAMPFVVPVSELRPPVPGDGDKEQR